MTKNIGGNLCILGEGGGVYIVFCICIRWGEMYSFRELINP